MNPAKSTNAKDVFPQQLHYLYLNTRKPKLLVNDLDRHQLQRRLGSEPRTNRDEPSPQTGHAPLLYRLLGAVHEAVVQLGVRRLVHQLRPQHVRGRDGHGHEEPGHERRGEGRPRVLPAPPRLLRHDPLRQVVHAHLRRVQDARAHDVDLHAAVKALEALIPIQIADERAEGGAFGARLRHRFADVEGVADEGADAAGEGSREELEVEGRIGGARSDGISHGRV